MTGTRFKTLGYAISIVSVLLLGAVAWPGPGKPAWQLPCLVAGMATSIGGMILRWVAHAKQQRRFRRIEERLGLTGEA